MWGYSKENGPSTWSKEFPVAGGVKQSPIDINVDKCERDGRLGRVNALYSPIAVKELGNTGSSWKAQISDNQQSSLTGGPLGNEFMLEQFHCHWGRTDERGSEHTVNGQKYAAELHLVHWNTQKFKSFGEAAASPDGLAVLGIFLKVGQEHQELLKITKLLPFIRFKGQSISVVESIQPGNFLPKNPSYWTYPGSLTTPPCYESVNWIVYENPIEISEQQMAAFRSMKSFHPCEKCPEDELAGCMFDNYRPPCPLNQRTVRVFRQNQTEE